MKVVAHCFAENASITPYKFEFKFGDYNARLSSVEEKLTLQISKIMSPEDLLAFSKSIFDSPADSNTVRDILEQRLKPYKLVLTDAAQLWEGLFSLFYATVPPHFDTGRIQVNLNAENEIEQKQLDEGAIIRGGGYILMPENKNYRLDESLVGWIAPSLNHLPAFSFFSQALRSLKNNDHEVAFFLFFRILDGYFANGAKKVKSEFLQRAAELNKFLISDERLVSSLKKIMAEMKLTSTAEIDFIGVISDIVLIRHKLTHFSSTKQQFHHSARIRFELSIVNEYFYTCCFNLLRNKLSGNLAIDNDTGNF
jgi:hypothetical protein